MTLTATEYFISYYDSEHVLRYRCRIGNMTKGERDDFVQKSGIENVQGYSLESVNDLSLETTEKRKEHIRVREDFESLPEWGHTQSETLQMRCFLFTAELAMESRRVMELQYGEPPAVPYFADTTFASVFYEMERGIIEVATANRIRALDKEAKKLCEGTVYSFDLAEESRTRLDEIGKEKKSLTAALKEKLHELRELQEVVLTASTLPDTIGTEPAKDSKATPKRVATKKPKCTRKRTSKYEQFTQAYLEHLAEQIMEADPKEKLALQAKVANSTAMDIAEKIQDKFKAQIKNVESRVRKTKAWEKRKETLKHAMASYYNNHTFNTRQNTKSSFQKVQ